MLTMATKTLCKWFHCANVDTKTLPMMTPVPLLTMTPKHCANDVHCANVDTKTLCQWWPLYHCWPWHQNTVPMMSTVPMLFMATKTLCQWCPLCQWPPEQCQWWPLCQCWRWPPKHCDNDDRYTNVDHSHQNTVPMMSTVPMLTMTTKTLCQWWPLCQCWPCPPNHCANDDHCANVDHVHQITVPMMSTVPMLTMATCGVINTITRGVIYKWNVWNALRMCGVPLECLEWGLRDMIDGMATTSKPDQMVEVN